MMNAEQKQAARNLIDDFKDAGNEWDEAAVASHMTALLQELVDAPEPEPVAWNVEGKDGEAMCVTDNKFAADRYIACGYVVEPLYTAPPAPSVPDVARDAARYRWLLNQAWFQQAADRFDFTDGGMQIRFEKCMDEFIDAAMSEKGQS